MLSTSNYLTLGIRVEKGHGRVKGLGGLGSSNEERLIGGKGNMMCYKGEGEWGLRQQLGEKEVMKRYTVRSNKWNSILNRCLYIIFQWPKNTT